MTTSQTTSTQQQAIDFYFDPSCPWAWRTTLWIREVEKVRPIEVTWKFLSLAKIAECRSLLSIPTWASLSPFDQDGKPFLGEMMVVGQHLGKTHLTHRVHGNTIHQAVRFVGTAGVKIQSLRK